MIQLRSFKGLHLRGGFVIAEVRLTSEPLRDALGREAIAHTTVTGNSFHVLIRRGLSQKELSVTLYHEVLEAALVASTDPPKSLMDFNEGDFERAAHQAHDVLGLASPGNLNRMLQDFGFGEE